MSEWPERGSNPHGDFSPRDFKVRTRRYESRFPPGFPMLRKMRGTRRGTIRSPATRAVGFLLVGLLESVRALSGLLSGVSQLAASSQRQAVTGFREHVRVSGFLAALRIYDKNPLLGRLLEERYYGPDLSRTNGAHLEAARHGSGSTLRSS
jgi:hypothetical protein